MTVRNAMKHAVFAPMIAASACAAPTAPTSAPRAPQPAVWVLSGQSNAVALRGPLGAFATVTGVQQNAQPIAAWDDGQPLWAALQGDLLAPHQAFVWWQGESDAADPGAYLVHLTAFLARVRVVGDAPVVICSANGVAAFDELRRVQREYAAAHGAAYVATDDLPIPSAGDFDVPTQSILPSSVVPNTVPHLTAAGYRIVAERVAQAQKGK